MTIACTGAMLNAALYLAGVFVAGLMMHNTEAWMLALLTAGVTYLSYLAAVPRLHYRDGYDPTPMIVTPQWQRDVQRLLTVCSIGLGIAAGLVLLF